MTYDHPGKKIAILGVLMIFVLACSFSFDLGGEEEMSAPEKTLQALYLEETAAALADMESFSEIAEEDKPVAVSIDHEIIPSNPGSPDVEKEEIDTKNTADTRTALGDSFRLSNYERPFTEEDMVYHPELDLVKLLLAEGNDFYYFTFEMSAPGKEGFGNGYYGVEFDTDYDGRGDYLLWAKGTSSTEWIMTDVMLYEDVNGDVGGSNPVVPDTNEGDGYERLLFGPEALDDPDVAWVRSDPTDSDNIQLAVKKSYIDKNRWYWRAWADAGIADAAMFDYNDQFTEKEAGSPNKNGGFYPIAALHMMDSTCWIAYNLTPTGTEVGGCVQVQPTQQAPPPADEPEEPGCDCSISYRQLSRECCTVCGDYMWDSAINQCVTMY